MLSKNSAIDVIVRGETMADNNIDYETLRRDLTDEHMAAFICGGIGPALPDSLDIEKASDEELERIAGR